MDRDLHAWLGGPLDRLPEATLQAAFAVTSRTPQRSRLAATLAGTPTMRESATRLPITRQILVAAALLLALAVALFIAGRWLQDQRVVVAPTAPPSTTLPTGPPPSGPPSSDGPLETPDVTTVFQVPGSTVAFRTVLSGDWRRSSDEQSSEGEVRITARTEIGPSFDPIVTAWVSIRVTTDPIDVAEAQAAADGWTEAPEPIDVAGLTGVIVTAPAASALDPVALVTDQGITYRILGHDDDGPSNGRAILDGFLRRFTPLGAIVEEAAYVDPTWGFSLSYDAAAGRFLPGIELGGGVTRFADVACGAGSEATCDRFVDVIRAPNVSPLHLHLPDGRDVELKIYTKSAEYVRLAQEWEAKVGTSRGSSAYSWQGTIIYNVDNVTIHARFIHRDDQWLVVLSAEDVGADHYRLGDFLDGLSLLTPEVSPSPTS